MDTKKIIRNLETKFFEQAILVQFFILAILFSAIKYFIISPSLGLILSNNITHNVSELIQNFSWYFITWFMLAKYTMDKKNTLISFILSLTIALVFQLINYNQIHVSFLLKKSIESIPFILFGFLHFKSPKGLFLVLLIPFKSSLFLLFPPYLKFLAALLVNGNIGSIDILYNAVPMFNWTFEFLMTLIIYNYIKNQPSKKQLFNIFELFGFDKNTFVVVFFTIRLWLLFASFYIFEIANNHQIFGLYDQLQIIFYGSLICFFAISFMNYICNFLMDFGKYPKWIYLILNLPFLNVLGLVILRLNSIKVPNWRDSSESIDSSKVSDLQNKFVDEKRNKSIKILLIAFSVLSTYYFLSSQSSTEEIISEFIAFILIILYMDNKNMIYIAFAYNLLALTFLPNFSFSHNYLTAISPYVLINSILFYPLFHFDSMYLMKLNRS